MEKKGNKTYYFTASLNPAEYCKEFNPGELELMDGYRLDIFYNGITIWNPSLKANFNKVNTFVREAFDIIIPAFIFREHIISKRIFKLSLNMQKCIEAMNTRAEHNLIWTLDYPAKIYKEPNRKARVNVTWRRIAKYFRRVQQSTHHKVMLKDYQNSISDSGDNAFFFAYRIIEDIRLAINSEKGITEEGRWDEVHKALRTSKTFMDPLTEVAVKVRHGDIKSPLVIKTRRKNRRKKVSNIAYELMKREFKRKFPGFL